MNHVMTVVKHYHAGTLPEQEWRVYSSGMAHLMDTPGGEWILDHCAITPDVRAALRESIDEGLKQKDGYLGIRTKTESKNTG